ncbi:MAG: UMP kinase [uncultured bacterium]|nr:MAG: UMP kinase [uncultured bacterium]
MDKSKRILFKLSGEVFASSDKSEFFDDRKILNYAQEITQISNKGIEIIVVVGGGNIYRGRENKLSFLKQEEADWIGLNATILNGIVLKYALENRFNKKSQIVSFYSYQEIIEKFDLDKTNKDLKDNKIIISVAMGKPRFSTDTISANLAHELNCDMILKGTKVDGVYSADPMINKNAKKYDRLSYQEAIDQNLKVMDQEAFKICQQNHIPIKVFNIFGRDNIVKAAMGEDVGTVIN